jgi:hypothetical protein
MLNRVAVVVVIFYIGAALVVHAASAPTAGSGDANNPCKGSAQQYKCDWPKVEKGIQCLKGRRCKADQSKAVVGATCQGPTDCSDVGGQVTNEKGQLQSPELPRDYQGVDYYGSNGVGGADAPIAPVDEYTAPTSDYSAPESGSTYMESPGAAESVQGPDAADTLGAMANDNTVSPVDTSAQAIGDYGYAGVDAQDIVNAEHGLNQNFFVPDGAGTDGVLNSPGGEMYNYNDSQTQLSSDSFGNSGDAAQNVSGDTVASTDCGVWCDVQSKVTELKAEVVSLLSQEQELGMLQSSPDILHNSGANAELAGYAGVSLSSIPTSYTSAYGAEGSYDLITGISSSNNFLDQAAAGEVSYVAAATALPANWTTIRYVDTTPH